MLDYTITDKRRTSSNFGKLSVFFFFIGAVAWLVKKQNLQLSGRHKKHEVEFTNFPSGSGKTKYRDS